jgi:hypothetical protein
MKYLISYVYDRPGYADNRYGCDVTEDPAEWIWEAQQYECTFTLLNALPITDEQAERFDGCLKGM